MKKQTKINLKYGIIGTLAALSDFPIIEEDV